jgi:hypothetical protein
MNKEKQYYTILEPNDKHELFCKRLMKGEISLPEKSRVIPRLIIPIHEAPFIEIQDFNRVLSKEELEGVIRKYI